MSGFALEKPVLHAKTAVPPVTFCRSPCHAFSKKPVSGYRAQTKAWLHELMTQVNHRMQIALPRPAFEPRISFLDVEYFHVSEAPYRHGMEEYYVEGSVLKVYSPAKTVADLFKFRSRHGTDLALESLRDTWRERKASFKEPLAAVKICRVERIMEPYLEATVS